MVEARHERMTLLGRKERQRFRDERLVRKSKIRVEITCFRPLSDPVHVDDLSKHALRMREQSEIRYEPAIN